MLFVCLGGDKSLRWRRTKSGVGARASKAVCGNHSGGSLFVYRPCFQKGCMKLPIHTYTKEPTLITLVMVGSLYAVAILTGKVSIYQTNRPYSRRDHDGQKERLGLQIYCKFARQYVNCEATSL